MEISRAVMAVGGVALAAAIGFTNPKSVQAVTAALVQVANTASNPVMSSEISRTAAQTICLYSGLDDAGERTPFQAMIPGGGLESGAYVVPDGENLVITEIDIETGLGGTFQLLPVTTGPSGGSAPVTLRVPADNLTHQFLFPNGIVWPSGSNFPSYADPGLREETLRGYLTRN
jgi:hypothetical protein